MNFYPRYVTVDDFKNFTGIDLRAALRSDDNVSNQAERFLLQTEDHLMAWIDKNSFRTLDYDHLNEKQLENFRKAILSQALYTYKNGAIALGLESGYDSERGIVTDSDKLAQLEVCQSAINYLSNAGLFNLNIKNRPRVMRGYPGLEQMFPDGGGGPAINNNQVYGFDPNAYVTLGTDQNIQGQKLFAKDILLGENVGLKAGEVYLVKFDGLNDAISFGKKLAPVNDGLLDIGSSTNRFKNIYFTGYFGNGDTPYGLVLPNTSGWSENKVIATLDDVSGNVTIDTTVGSESISDESASLDVVTRNTEQIITAQKIFETSSLADGTRQNILSAGGVKLYRQNSAGTFSSSVELIFDSVLVKQNDSSYTITFPRKSGIFALTSELGKSLSFPSSWPTSSTTAAFCAAVNADETAVQGSTFLGEVTLSDMPAGLVNSELIVEVMSGSGTSGKVIHLILTSGNVAPYRWEYTYWNNGTNVSGWIAFATRADIHISATDFNIE